MRIINRDHNSFHFRRVIRAEAAMKGIKSVSGQEKVETVGMHDKEDKSM